MPRTGALAGLDDDAQLAHRPEIDFEMLAHITGRGVNQRTAEKPVSAVEAFVVAVEQTCCAANQGSGIVQGKFGGGGGHRFSVAEDHGVIGGEFVETTQRTTDPRRCVEESMRGDLLEVVGSQRKVEELDCGCETFDRLGRLFGGDVRG